MRLRRLTVAIEGKPDVYKTVKMFETSAENDLDEIFSDIPPTTVFICATKYYDACLWQIVNAAHIATAVFYIVSKIIRNDIIPAQAGIHLRNQAWFPVFTGMTVVKNF